MVLMQLITSNTLEVLGAFVARKAQSLTDMFVHHIQNMILSGELLPGIALPTIRELTEKMKVSPPVVTAGLVELEKMGFVQVTPRIGTVV